MVKRIRVFYLVLSCLFAIGVFQLNCSSEPVEVPVLKVGHVGHDHHTALYVAALNGDKFRNEFGLYLKEVREKELYEMWDGDKIICELELYKAGGGSKMPTDMAQGVFDVGFGGLAAVAFFTDKGTPMKIISPLHSKGDMLVVNNEISAGDWNEFVTFLKNRNEPLKVGFKAPKAIALIIFETALKHEGISFTYDAGDRNAKVQLVNMKGAKNLNPGLSNSIIDAYVCNNPFCAVAEDKGIGKSIADLNDLPPGLWKDHPCCVIGAMEDVIVSKRKELVKFLELMTIATDYMNSDPRIAVESASKWIGTSIAVEEISIPTSSYLTEPNEVWLNGSYVWAKAMDDLGHIQGSLHDKTKEETLETMLDLSLINEARKNVENRKNRD